MVCRRDHFYRVTTNRAASQRWKVASVSGTGKGFWVRVLYGDHTYQMKHATLYGATMALRSRLDNEQ